VIGASAMDGYRRSVVRGSVNVEWHPAVPAPTIAALHV